jgi:hypothetical protein
MAALGIPAAGLVVYDLSKSRGLQSDVDQFRQRMAKPTRPVDVKTFVKKMDRNVGVVGTPAAFDRMVKSEFKGHPIKSAVVRALEKPFAFSGDNAFAFVGPSGKGYIIGKGVLSEAVVRHELGHVKDYQSRKANMLHRGTKRSLLRAASPLSRRAFDRTVYRDEKAAWRLAGDSPDRKDYEDVALGTYDKSFHRNRAALVGSTTGALFLPAMMERLIKRASQGHEEKLNMNDTIFHAFQDELEKIARVPKAVKQYRRLLQEYAEARSNPSLFHGTHPKYVEALLDSGRLKPALGTHGTGVYMWKGRPRSTYMRWPDSEKYPRGFPGVFAKAKDLKLGKTPVDPRKGGPIAQGAYSERQAMAISEDPIDLPKGRTTLVADREQLRELREKIKKRRFRQMDSRILHRLEADMQAKRLDAKYQTEQYARPTKRDLVRLLRDRKRMPYVGMTRRLPTSKKDVNRFFGQYDEVVGRTPERNAAQEFDYI